MDNALAAVDHVAARVTAAAATGLAGGAAYATLRGFPLFKTSVNASVSCALVGTACFGMERVAHGLLRQSSALLDKSTDDEGPSPSLVYASHALGGFCGGGVVGFLFGGKQLAGAFLLTPLMLGIGTIEQALEEYRTERLRQLLEDRDDEREQK